MTGISSTPIAAGCGPATASAAPNLCRSWAGDEQGYQVRKRQGNEKSLVIPVRSPHRLVADTVPAVKSRNRVPELRDPVRVGKSLQEERSRKQ